MKSRMEKYYKEENISERTKKNDSLYDELYHEKQKLDNNVTVIDNVSEIDLTKIKEMVNRENYKKIRDYNLINKEETKEDSNLSYNTNYNVYDINEVIKQKKIEKNNSNKIRKISDEDYKVLESLSILEKNDNKSIEDNETNIKHLLTTLTNIGVDDLFSNLREETQNKDITNEDNFEKENTIEVTIETKEDSFFSKRNDVIENDFDDSIKGNGSIIYIIIAVLGLIAAIFSIIYIKIIQ